jgi:hypothetical protein
VEAIAPVSYICTNVKYHGIGAINMRNCGSDLLFHVPSCARSLSQKKIQIGIKNSEKLQQWSRGDNFAQGVRKRLGGRV